MKLPNSNIKKTLGDYIPSETRTVNDFRQGRLKKTYPNKYLRAFNLKQINLITSYSKFGAI